MRWCESANRREESGKGGGRSGKPVKKPHSDKATSRDLANLLRLTAFTTAVSYARIDVG